MLSVNVPGGFSLRIAWATFRDKTEPVMTPTGIAAVLAERGTRYGPFSGHAEVTQRLKKVIENHLGNSKTILSNVHQEALDMICHKIGRIVNGDPNYADSWVDIAGYAQLVVDKIEGKQNA